MSGIYVASRASVPERPEMWKRLRSEGWPIISTWIDEAEAGATASFRELWQRIHAEIKESDGIILYAKAEDFPMKGAFIECGIALGMGKPIAVVMPGVILDGGYRPIGTWILHPLVSVFGEISSAREWIAKQAETPLDANRPSG